DACNALYSSNAGTLSQSTDDGDLLIEIKDVCHAIDVLQKYAVVKSFCDTVFRMILKRLAIAILFTIVLPIHGQERGSKSGSNRSNGNSSQNVTDSPSGTATCVVKQEGTAIECRWPKDVPESKLRRLFSPENAPN